jgi:hypothetical protein
MGDKALENGIAWSDLHNIIGYLHPDLEPAYSTAAGNAFMPE